MNSVWSLWERCVCQAECGIRTTAGSENRWGIVFGLDVAKYNSFFGISGRTCENTKFLRMVLQLAIALRIATPL